MTPKIIKVRTLAEFTKATESILTSALTSNPAFEGNWYRGVGNATFGLRPSLFRHPVLDSIEELLKTEYRMLEDFQRQSVLHTEAMGSTTGDAELRTLFYMQHYGVPTRLLDWSTNPFIALYFALTNANTEGGEDAAVWVLNPTVWNSIALKQRNHGDAGALSSQQAVTSHGPRKLFEGDVFAPAAMSTLFEQAACCRGISNNARMFAQRGVFSIFGKSLKGMEEQFAEFKYPADALIKITIPNDVTAVLLTLLLKLGYTDSVSYPDLTGLAMEIKRLRGFKVT